MKLLLAILLLTFGCTPLIAQEEFVPPDAKLISRIPFFQLSGGIIILKAQLNQFTDSLNFVLDTGSGGISLDSSAVERLKLPTALSEKNHPRYCWCEAGIFCLQSHTDPSRIRSQKFRLSHQ